MILTLKIENQDGFDDGGPVEITVQGKGLTAGRGRSMDWVLPDPTRHISSQHFEVDFAEGAYFLTDVSTNGTFLVGQPYRLEPRYRLNHMDRFQVGHFIIAVSLQSPSPSPGTLTPPGWTPHASPSGGDDPWAVDGPTPAPIDTSPKPGRSGGGDFDLAAISTPPASFGGGSGGGLSVPPGAPRPPAPPDPSGSPFGAAGLSRPPGGFTGAPSAAPPPLSRPPGGFGSGEGLSPPVPPAVPDPAPIPPAPPPPGFATQGVTPPPPMPDPAPSAPVPADSSAVVRAFCEGAGLRPDAYAHVDAEALARTLGVAMRLVVQETMVLLHDRAQAKLVTQAGEGTMTRAEGNNPLKFLPDAEQALVAMFLVGQPGFKGGPEAFADAFRDLRLHQKGVFEALQPALAKLMGDLSPEAIEEEAGGGLLGGSPWKTFVARWDAKSADHDNGILDEFFVHFAEAYGRATRRDQ